MQARNAAVTRGPDAPHPEPEADPPEAAETPPQAPRREDAPPIPGWRDLIALWREDLRAHRGRLFAPGFQALAVHRFGVFACARRSRLAMRVLRRLYIMLEWVTRSLHGIELPVKARIGRRTRFAHQGGVVIHKEARIGADCLVRHGVTLGVLRDRAGTRAPRVGDRVEIGAGAVLLGDIAVGDDAVVGANVVVRTDVPSGAVVLPPDPVIVPRRVRSRARRTDARTPPA